MPEVLTAGTFREGKMETPYVSFWMDPEGFLCARYADDLHLSYDAAVSVVESRIFFAKGQSYPVLVDMRGIKSTTKEARQYMATVGATLVTAGALITGSTINKMLGNIFLTIDKPPIPAKLFTKEASAREWLRRYL